ncbi:DUF1349 domain-containing protein [uncultured Demequina sp.]|uniref:beta-xylosidase family glycoside hydrolase n=1 Tax=uncultured Demequina sp. TaxID=693499 RepID=UPI0025F36FCD|nr:DUF1349 domain-containing protein [uncultured Demequina sp.]
MKHQHRMRAPGAIAAALALGAALAVPASAETADPPENWPEFGYQGVITDKSEMIYNPTDEFIFPSVFHAGAFLDDPLGEWYLYLAPHDAPGGIMLMYADSLEGPWTEYADNPIIERDWDPHFDVSHISSPDAIWNEQADELYLYFHGENSTTRWATTTDGVTFEYGGVAVTTAMASPITTESSYGRVFEHPDTDGAYAYGMFYMANETDNRRKIRLAESVDGETWTVAPDYVVYPGEEEGANVSGADLWEWDGQLYVIYHASSGKSYARTIDPTLREVGEEPIVLHEASGIGDDVGRVAAPEVVTHDGETYLFYESGDRLGATIAWAKDGAEVVVPQPFGGFPEDVDNPVFEQCAAPGSDEFDGALADGTWDRVVREDLARHEVVDDALVIPTYAGGVSAAPLLQQELPDGPWQVTTRVEIDPAQRYQQAGLLLYASDTHYAKLDLVEASGGRTVELVYHRDGGNRQDAAPPETGQSELWLRYTSDGTSIRASVSYDGEQFTRYGRDIDAELAGFTHVGPYAFRGGASTPEIEASFDWFRFSPDADAYQDCLDAQQPPEDDETAVPAPGVLSSTSGWSHGLHDGTFEVRWDMWWGANASRITLYQDGVEVATRELEAGGPTAQHAAFPISGLADGEYEFVLEAVNSQGSTRTAPLTVSVTDARPGVPVLSHDNWDRDGSYVVTANLWWGTNATAWELFEDGEPVASGELEAASPAAQRVEVALDGRASGEHEYVIVFANHAGETSSQPRVVTVAP